MVETGYRGLFVQGKVRTDVTLHYQRLTDLVYALGTHSVDGQQVAPKLSQRLQVHT